MKTVEIHQCVRKACSFRFPAEKSKSIGINCPKCGSNTIVQVSFPENRPFHPVASCSNIHLEGFLDNLRSVFNVGSIFRTADGCGVKKLHLGGITPPPTHPGMAKTALGADQHVPWSQYWDGLSGILTFKKEGFEIIGLEYTSVSKPIFEYQNPGRPILLVVGNENHGIDPEILDASDKVIHIPMAGYKESLNVSTAFSIAAYWLTYGIK